MNVMAAGTVRPHGSGASQSAAPGARTNAARFFQNSSWITRSFVAFGRYPDKRPENLEVTADGWLCLSNLMRTWGRPHGLTQDQVLTAIEEHMFHDDIGQTPRFRIAGDHVPIRIRVLPKRSGRNNATVPMPARLPDRRCCQAALRPAVRPRPRGSVADSLGRSGFLRQHTQSKKLSMSLDELIESDRSEQAAAAATTLAGRNADTASGHMQRSAARKRGREKLSMSLDELIATDRFEQAAAAAATGAGKVADTASGRTQRSARKRALPAATAPEAVGRRRSPSDSSSA